jgi:tRNA(Ile)-lysidine synthase TilS/MesJ
MIFRKGGILWTCQKLLSFTRKAIDDYKMIDDGDKIAIGVSGGKDSLTLLYALTHLTALLSQRNLI